MGKDQKTIRLKFDRDYWPTVEVVASRDGEERIVEIGGRIYAGEIADLPESEAIVVSENEIAKLSR